MKIKEKIAKQIEAPRDIFLNETKISVFSDREILLENYKSILEYDENFVRIKLKDKSVVISGADFSLDEMTDESIVVSGKIKGIEFVC